MIGDLAKGDILQICVIKLAAMLAVKDNTFS
jgi:hypothetical protein